MNISVWGISRIEAVYTRSIDGLQEVLADFGWKVKEFDSDHIWMTPDLIAVFKKVRIRDF